MASKSINKVELLGNLTKDPESKTTESGTLIAIVSLATNRSWKTQSGEIKEDVQYHRIIAWDKLAQIVQNLLVKGSRAYIEGRITYRTFGEDTDKRTITEIVMNDFILLDHGKPRVTDNSDIDI